MVNSCSHRNSVVQSIAYFFVLIYFRATFAYIRHLNVPSFKKLRLEGFAPIPNTVQHRSNNFGQKISQLQEMKHNSLLIFWTLPGTHCSNSGMLCSVNNRLQLFLKSVDCATQVIRKTAISLIYSEKDSLMNLRRSRKQIKGTQRAYPMAMKAAA